MMRVLTVANRKGGSGKSTCAAHIAVEAEKNNIKTILIDMDPQKTLKMWWTKRPQEVPRLIETTADNLGTTIRKLSSLFDLCIIDTPGDASQNAIESIKMGNLVVIPSNPTVPDLSAIGRTINIVKEKEKKFIFILTRVITRAKATIQSALALSKFGELAPSYISNRVSYANAMGMGSSAALIDKTAAEEMTQIWDFLKSLNF